MFYGFKHNNEYGIHHCCEKNRSKIVENCKVHVDYRSFFRFHMKKIGKYNQFYSICTVITKVHQFEMFVMKIFRFLY